MTMLTKSSLAVAVVLICSSASTTAAEWSDTSLSWRIGNRFGEPFNPLPIRKNIVALTHASGYQYGTNFFNIDLLQSDRNDPGSLTQRSGAQEAYVLYRHTFDIGKLRGAGLSFGPVSAVGATVGFDWNTKNDVGYNSRKRMLVAGPTLTWKAPGLLQTSLLLLHESNAPSGAFPPILDVRGRTTYKLHPMLTANWGIPIGNGFKFEGYANLIAAKGRDEVGNQTGPETNIDMQLMYDVGAAMGSPKNVFRIGLEYQFWNNKFGNTAVTTGGRGQRASTPMIRADVRF
ncbi:outer envelope protein [Massilia psychrophila]|uniref:Outer envelope protein n=1 Tax=Massilia psychrophila TaxID=1603353 RepID=A0A2G8SZM2_9BURK|nr:outer envelope protein [Massilia psychrophila]PIL39240.1 outer envelope protein [Massilia psychrophila]